MSTPSDATAVSVEFPVIESHALADNPLHDPVTRMLPVILPPGYSSSSRRYPVIVGLTGFTGRGLMLLNDDAWQPNLTQRLERLYAAGMPHAIFVLPDCFTRYGGSQYINSSATGQYEDYVIDEIIPWVDAHYRTIADPAGRAVFGKSSGGYGAMIYGLRHPDVFGAIACHSGDMAFELCYAPDFPDTCLAFTRAGGVAAWWEQFAAQVKKKPSDFKALNILAMAACYSSDPAEPLGIAFPMDFATCERKPDVWARWLAWDPIEMLASHAYHLRQLKLLYMDCGAQDQFNLQFGARQMSHRLTALGIAHAYEEFDDNHNNIQYRYDVSLPKLAHALASE
ncbi:MAG: alpha/beta hydrolase [Ktedonobacterales bacterium]|jgi:enterochelin esterase family protein